MCHGARSSLLRSQRRHQLQLLKEWRVDMSTYHWEVSCVSTPILVTPWKLNIAPENGWLEDEFPFGKTYFQGLC